MATKEEIIEIKRIKTEEIEVEIEGITPLIMHEWSEKAKREMLEAQQAKLKTKAKEPRNPAYEFIQSIHWIEGKPDVKNSDSEEKIMKAFEKAIKNGARFGFPANGFKAAACSAAYRLGWTKNKTAARAIFFIKPDTEDGLVEIKAETVKMREDMVRINKGTTSDLRYRCEFDNWTATLKIIFNTSGTYSKSDVINLIEAGGFASGIGEWRPDKCCGDYGRFRVKGN